MLCDPINYVLLWLKTGFYPAEIDGFQSHTGNISKIYNIHYTTCYLSI